MSKSEAGNIVAIVGIGMLAVLLYRLSSRSKEVKILSERYCDMVLDDDDEGTIRSEVRQKLEELGVNVTNLEC